MAERGTFWRWIIAALDAGEPVALLIVADSVGSSPGRAGDKMAVMAAGSQGSIGGGWIESEMMDTARDMLAGGAACPQIFRRAHYPSKIVATSGMICGGEQAVLIYPCRQEDRCWFEQLVECSRAGTPAMLCVSERGLEVLAEARDTAPVFSDGLDWQYRESIGRYRQAYVIGGGHVGLALSKILDTLDFDITVIDDREALDTMNANAYAKKLGGVPYASIAEYIPEGPDVYVFVMTHNHQGDELVLTQLVGKPLAYLGLLGSRHKIAQLRTNLAKKLPADHLSTLHAPMGLPINSHTPAEIAISIAAELIQLGKF